MVSKIKKCRSRRKCIFHGCRKCSQGRTKYCVSHGGGRRCIFHGCPKSAASNTFFCIKHGGGRRCIFYGCKSSVVSPSKIYCFKHGGGRRCIYPFCNKSSRNKDKRCIAHKNRCIFHGCKKDIYSPSILYCIDHGGFHPNNRKCILPYCNMNIHNNSIFCLFHNYLDCSNNFLPKGTICIKCGFVSQ